MGLVCLGFCGGFFCCVFVCLVGVCLFVCFVCCLCGGGVLFFVLF